MLVTEFPIVTVVRALSWNAELPMLVTEFGMVTLVRAGSLLSNARLSMVVTELPPSVAGMTRVAGQVLLVQPVTVAPLPVTVYSNPSADRARAPLGAAKLTASSRARAAERARLAGIDSSPSDTMCRAREAQPWCYAT